MKDLSYLQAFTPKALRSARRILEKGFTAEDIDRFLEEPKKPMIRLVKPCCGGNKVDKQVRAFRDKQRKLKMERLK